MSRFRQPYFPLNCFILVTVARVGRSVVHPNKTAWHKSFPNCVQASIPIQNDSELRFTWVQGEKIDDVIIFIIVAVVIHTYSV